MALLVAHTMGRAEHESASLHPFFTKPLRDSPLSTVKDDIPDSATVIAAESNSKTKTGKGKEKGIAGKTDTDSAATISATAAMLEVDPNTGRRKRVRTSSVSRRGTGEKGVETISAHPLEEPNKQEMEEDEGETSIQVNACSERATATCRATDASRQSSSPAPIIQQPPLSTEGGRFLHKSTPGLVVQLDNSKKLLQLNRKTGTIGHPPAKKANTSANTRGTEKISKTRGRKLKTQITVIRYGDDQPSRLRIGTRINQIMKSAKAVCDSSVKSRGPVLLGSTSKPPHFFSKTEAVQKPKTTHPFFAGRTAEHPRASAISATNRPIAPEHAVRTERPTLSLVSGRGRPQALGTDSLAFAGFGKTERLFKFPGAMDPAWPWEGMQHIRGHSQHSMNYGGSLLPTASKKRKGQAVEILYYEDILNITAASLDIAATARSINDNNVDGFTKPSPCLRISRKHIETGPTLQRRIRKELHTRLQDPSARAGQSSSEDEIQTINRCDTVHPALQKLFDSTATSLSPFDCSQCESQAWTAKYAPKKAVEVLQIGREPVILKEWLQSLTIQAVDTGTGEPQNRTASVTSKRPGASKSDASAKRKRKSKKIDDFIVSDDEDEMDEVSEPEDVDNLRLKHGCPTKTVVRTYKAKESRKLGNAVLVSGPHGSGKTASVYAVAKELGFEVFEINASSRRSGKDILEKVGDMTRNHLVQSSSNATHDDDFDDDLSQISDSLAADLKSGRQGTMNSFFKPKVSAQPKVVNPRIAENKKEDISGRKGIRTPSKHQRQSLILLEEVDILYEEDKQFWATVMPLITSSKRPLIMTCTDEAAIPLQGLWPQLHAILRYSPTPTDLAVDYMLLVAANEGHALQRSAVEALYEGRHCDLRASLMDLDFWCQFTVGDRKGGLEWFYPRWPLGCDVDEHGDTLRVVSEGTYEAGMGWLSRDYLKGQSHILDIEEEMLREVWEGWNLDLGNWQHTLDISSWARDRRKISSGHKDDYAALSIYEDFADSLSVSDICSAGTFSTTNQITLDVGLPELSAKTKEDYVLAWELLEAHPKVVHDRLSADLSTWIKSRARNILQVEEHIKHGLEIPQELGSLGEKQTIDIIREHSIYVDPSLTRLDFSLAFDPISTSEKKYIWGNSNVLEASCFDRTLSLIVHDVAPFVRSIVAYDAKLLEERTRLSNLLSKGDGGRKGKRMRTTRSALSALEGRTRKTTRKEKYFDAEHLNPYLVLATASSSWQAAATAELENAQAELESLPGTSTREVSEEVENEADARNDELQDE